MQLMHSQKNKKNRGLVGLAAGRIVAALFSVFLIFQASPGFAADELTIGDTIVNFIGAGDESPGMIAGICYMIGLVFGFTGVLKLKEHVEKGDAQVPIWEPIKRFVAGGALFALPMISEVLRNSLVSDETSGFDYSGFAGDASGGGLDTMMVNLIADIWEPMHIVVAVFSYIAGLIFMMIGILRLIKTSQDGPRGPGGFGTIMTFVTAAILFSMDELMGAFLNSIFGDPGSSTSSVLAYGEIGLSPGEQAHIQAVISAVVGFVAIVGWISFLRGWFILRGVGEGDQQSSLMAAVTHIIAGVLCVNIGGVMNAIQFTLGIADYGVTFN